MSNGVLRSVGTFNIITVECQTLVQRGGTVNTLLLNNVKRWGGTNPFNILATECQTNSQWYEEVVSSTFHHCQFQEIVSCVT